MFYREIEHPLSISKYSKEKGFTVLKLFIIVIMLWNGLTAPRSASGHAPCETKCFVCQAWLCVKEEKCFFSISRFSFLEIFKKLAKYYNCKASFDVDWKMNVVFLVCMCVALVWLLWNETARRETCWDMQHEDKRKYYWSFKEYNKIS